MDLKTFLEKLELCVNLKTIYATGGQGHPLNETNKIKMLTYKANLEKRKKVIQSATSDIFAFDCIGLIKSIGWGFKADTKKAMGGAVYGSNGIKDESEINMINGCTKVSTDMSNIPVGALLYLKGHCGIYVGNGKVIESCASVGHVAITDFNRVKWLKWGLLPWVEYEQKKTETKKEEFTDDIIHTVKRGDTLWAIAKKYLGSGLKWREIASYNNIVGTNLKIGQKIKIKRSK